MRRPQSTPFVGGEAPREYPGEGKFQCSGFRHADG